MFLVDYVKIGMPLCAHVTSRLYVKIGMPLCAHITSRLYVKIGMSLCAHVTSRLREDWYAPLYTCY